MITFSFQTKVWLYPGHAAWHFITLPKQESQEIKHIFSTDARGFGSIPVTVTIGKTIWQTSIFPDKKSGAYLLPLKSEVRKSEHILVGDSTMVTLKIEEQ